MTARSNISMRARLAVIGVTAVLAAAGVAGCSDNSGGSGAPADDTFVYSASRPVVTDWDPATSYSNELWAMQNVYDSLTRYDSDSGKLVPRLATEWRSEADGRKWTFTLREGVKFHTGRTMDSTAAKAAIERTKQLAGGASYLWAAVQRIDTPDPTTLVFNLSFAAPLDLMSSAQYGAYIYDTQAAGSADLKAWFGEGKDAGTGPYKVGEWREGQENELRLDKFDDYWGGWDDEHYTTVEFRVTPEANTAAQLLRRGEVDYVQRLNPQLFEQVGQDDAVQTSETTSYQNLIALLNTASGPLRDVRLRQAVAAAVDYNGTVKALQDSVTEAAGVIPPGLLGHDPSLKPTQDLQRAADLLSQAGYGPGKRPLTLKMTYSLGDPDLQTVATLLTSTLAELNVTLQARALEWQAQWDQAKSTNTAARQDVFLFYWYPDFADPYSWFSNLFRSANPPLFNLAYYSNPAVDAAIDGLPAQTATSPTTAEATYRQLQRQLVTDEAVAVVFYQQRYQRAVASSVDDYTDDPAYANVVFAYDVKPRE